MGGGGESRELRRGPSQAARPCAVRAQGGAHAPATAGGKGVAPGGGGMGG
jgi:hypothetical protein